MLCKCSGKYIDIYFILKITYYYYDYAVNMILTLLREYKPTYVYNMYLRCNHLAMLTQCRRGIRQTLEFCAKKRGGGCADGSLTS